MERKNSNFLNEDINPCIEEGKLSTKCLEDTLYDYSKCELYFKNYRRCKKFWNYLSIQRRKAGITPEMPDKKEREKILALQKKGVNVLSANMTEDESKE